MAAGGEQAQAATVSAVRIVGDPEKGSRVGVIGKRTWTVTGGRAELSPEQVPIVEKPIYDPKRAVLVHDADVLLNRRRVDIVVDGHAYPPEGRTPFDVSLQVGAMRRVVRTFGPRRVTRDYNGRPLFSAPASVDRIALGWENAYGGVDMAARGDIGDPFEQAQLDAQMPADPRFGLFAYPRNPVGRGYVIEPSVAALEACQLPLLEDLASLLTPDNLVLGDFVRWPEGPVVAGFGWLSYDYFPRSAVLGAPPLIYDGARIPASGFHEVRSGDIPEATVRPERALTERLSLEVAQSAAIGMRALAVEPNDPVELVGLHPAERRWTFRIPTETPRMFVQVEGEALAELPPARIRTVLLQPDENRLTLVWVAETRIDFPPASKRLAAMKHAVRWR
jgi:hypothetical protein